MESLIVVVPLLVVAIVLQRRRRRTDRSSVTRHQRALKALVDIGARGAPPGLPDVEHETEPGRYFRRVEVAPDERTAGRPRRRSRPESRAARRPPIPPAPERPAAEAGPTVVLPGSSRGAGNPLLLHRPLLRARRRRPRRRVVLAAALVVAGLAGLFAWRAVDGDGSSTVSAGRDEARRDEAPATTVPRAGENSGDRLAPVTADERGAVYRVELPLTVTVSARETCWLRVRQGSAGAVIFEATLAKGQSRSFESSRPLSMRVGNPGAAQVEVNGTPVDVPARGSTPFLLRFG